MRSFAVAAGALLFSVVLLTGCGTSSSPRSGLTKITADQKELRALDGRAAAFKRGESPVSDAETLAADYHKLLDKARGQRPGGAKGDEAEVWRSFIGILSLRARAADILVRAARAGDFSHLDADIAPLNDKTRALNNSFNRALATFRGEKPPPDQAAPSPAVKASVSTLSDLKDRMDAIDLRVTSANTQPTSVEELRAIVAKWRSTVGDYSDLLAHAQPEAQRAYRLPKAGGLQLAETWRAFVSMVRQRRDGMSYTVSAFQSAIETNSVPPDLQARLQSLKRQNDQLNARFEKLASRLNEQLSG